MENPNFEGRAFTEPPDNWVMPQKNIGGHDMVRYFSLLFMNSISSNLVAKSKNFDAPFYANLEPLRQEIKKIAVDLQEKKLDVYPNGGTLFNDYKIMRDQWYKLLMPQGLQPTDIQAQFNESMSAEQFFEKAQYFVKMWWDVPLPTRAQS